MSSQEEPKEWTIPEENTVQNFTVMQKISIWLLVGASALMLFILLSNFLKKGKASIFKVTVNFLVFALVAFSTIMFFRTK